MEKAWKLMIKAEFGVSPQVYNVLIRAFEETKEYKKVYHLLETIKKENKLEELDPHTLLRLVKRYGSLCF